VEAYFQKAEEQFSVLFNKLQAAFPACEDLWTGFSKEGDRSVTYGKCTVADDGTPKPCEDLLSLKLENCAELAIDHFFCLHRRARIDFDNARVEEMSVAAFRDSVNAWS
jgi:hypothetical protein